MAADDTFRAFNSSLSEQLRVRLDVFIRQYQTELLAARSEDAKTRIVESYIKEAHHFLQQH